MSERYLHLGDQGFGTYDVDWATQSFRRVQGTADRLLVPGFVDIHIHGAFGVDFMTASEDEIRGLCARLAGIGYETLYPTTVSATLADVRKAIANLPAHPMIAGFHLEGPFINPKFPGAQPKDAIAEIPVGPSEWDEVFDDPRLKVITLAPELPNALALVERLAKRGVAVSMGHTGVTFAEAQVGFEHGVRHATHTYNQMSPLHHREAGAVGFTFVRNELYAELIYDRHHVSRPAAEVLIRMKPSDRVIAVSDGTMAAGLPDQTVRMWDRDCVVRDGQVRLLDGTLAGSSITLLDAFRNLHGDFGPEVAIRATSLNPRQSMGLGAPNVYLELDRNLELLRAPSSFSA